MSCIVKKEKVKREIKAMQTLVGSPSVVKYIDVVKDPATKTHSIVSSPVLTCAVLDNGVR